MSLADEIREFVYEHYIKPARERGLSEITIVSGELHARMHLKDRMPAVCSVLRGRKLQDAYGVRLIEERKKSNVKRDSSTNEFTFKLGT